MPITKQDLDSARQRLDEELKTVETELDDYGFPAEGEVHVHFDEGFADAAQATSERAKVLSLVEGLRQRRRELLAAIARVEKGTYGVCDRCGNEIPAERLEAIPTASLCIDCKSKGR